jgi:hypothetical protein
MAATQLNTSPKPGVMFRTTDATPTVAVNFPTRPSKVYWVELKVLATYSDTSKAAAYWLMGCFRTSAAGTLTQVGATASVITAIEDTGGMDCTMAASSTNVAVTVTGVAATNIQWQVYAEIMENDYIAVTM